VLLVDGVKVLYIILSLASIA